LSGKSPQHTSLKRELIEKLIEMKLKRFRFKYLETSVTVLAEDEETYKRAVKAVLEELDLWQL